MAVKVLDILNQVRYIITDTNKIQFQDEELLIYVNNALNFISDTLAGNNSSINYKSLTISTSSLLLPADTLRIDKIVNKYNAEYEYIPKTANVTGNTYSVFDNKIYVGNIPCTLYYWYRLAPYKTINDTFSLYAPLEEIIIDFVVIKCQSKLEYNMQLEEQKLAILTEKLKMQDFMKDGFSPLKRYDDYMI